MRRLRLRRSGGPCSTSFAGCVGRSHCATRCWRSTSLVFIKRHRAIFQHMCDQFYGLCQNPGGGLYVLENAFGENPVGARLARRERVSERPAAGPEARRRQPGAARRALRRPEGSDRRRRRGRFVSSRRRFRPTPGRSPSPTSSARVRASSRSTRIRLAGTGIRASAITCSRWASTAAGWRSSPTARGTTSTPAGCPTGRLAFITERRGGYLRCGRACPLYTLYDMNLDGSQINCLSFHDSNEWNPSVGHDGRIVWTRWGLCGTVMGALLTCRGC